MRRNPGAAKDGSVKVLVVASVIFERRKPKKECCCAATRTRDIVARSLDVRSPYWCGRPSDSGGRHVKGEHVKDAANADFQEAEKNRSAAARGDPDVSPPTHTRLPLGDI